MSGEHALLSPSSAHRWIYCTASVNLNAQYPDKGSSFAEEGTKAHALAENFLRNYESSTDALEFTDEQKDMFSALQPYFDVIWERKGQSLGTQLLVEVKLPLRPITGEWEKYGTADAVLLTPVDGGMKLTIVDLKFGRGVFVEAEGNEQLLLYLLAALDYFEAAGPFVQYELVISQPRVRDEPSVWFPTEDQVEEFRVKVRTAANAYFSGLFYAQPGEKQCRWCKHAPNCQDLAEMVQKATEMEELARASLAEKYLMVPLVRKWCDSIESATRGEMESGVPVPGLKLVAGGFGPRAWSHEPEDLKVVFKKLKLLKRVWVKEGILSPPELEKVIGPKGTSPDPEKWEKIQDHISRTARKPIIVKEDDKRPELVIDLADGFTNLDEEN